MCGSNARQTHLYCLAVLGVHIGVHIGVGSVFNSIFVVVELMTLYSVIFCFGNLVVLFSPNPQ